MNRLARVSLIVAGTMLAVGCSSSRSSHPLALTQGQVALGAFGEAEPGVFFFGAGDALGRDIFAVYLASLEGNDAYAAVE